MKGLRTKRVRTVKEGTLIATVDIGATTNTGYCTCRRRQGHKGFQVREHKGGVREVLAHDTSLPRTGSDCNEVMVGYESTGPYAEPLVHYLHGQACEHRPGQPPPYEEAERGQRQLSRQDGRQGSPGDRRHHTGSDDALSIVIPGGRCSLSPEAQQREGAACRRAHGPAQPDAAVGLPHLPRIQDGHHTR